MALMAFKPSRGLLTGGLSAFHENPGCSINILINKILLIPFVSRRYAVSQQESCRNEGKSPEGAHLRLRDQGWVGPADPGGSARGGGRVPPALRRGERGRRVARQSVGRTSYPDRRWTADAASARNFSPSAPTTLRTVSNVETRSPESAL